MKRLTIGVCALICALSVALGGMRSGLTQPSSTQPAPGTSTVYLSHRLLAFMKLAMNRPDKLLKLKQTFSASTVDELKALLDEKVKEKAVDSIAVLILRMGPQPAAELKMQSDLTLQSAAIAWAPAVVVEVAKLAEFFRMGSMRYDQDLTAMVNGNVTINSGWATLQVAKDSPFIAPELTASLAEAYTQVLKAKRAEFNGRIQDREPTALKIKRFLDGAPPTLRDGQIKWKGAVPDVAEADLRKLDTRFDEARIEGAQSESR